MPDRELTLPRVHACLDFLTRLGKAMLESGYSTTAVLHETARAAHSLGLRDATIVGLGRVVMVQHTAPDGTPTTKLAEADTLDAFDCDRMRRLKNVVREVGPATNDDCARLAAADRGPQPFPWWSVPAGGMLLAFCICFQIGGTVVASALAAPVFLLMNLCGRGLGALVVPKFFSMTVQATLAGGLGALLHLVGGLPLPQTAALVATVWLLIVPLPQLISMAIDVVNGHGLTASARAMGLLLIIGGISLGAVLVLALWLRFDVDGPIDPVLPVLPVWAGILFAVLGAIGNAFLNVGGRSLVLPAAGMGLLTASVNQALIHLAHLPVTWSAPLAAVVLGVVAAASSEWLKVPITALALVGITGALLPGLTVAQGLMVSVYEQSGAGYFGQALGICVGLGVGASFGVYLWTLVSRRPLG